jgi:two-component system response regulator QseB
MRLLLVEDDEDLADALLTGLKKHDFSIDWIKDGIRASQYGLNPIYELIILDLGLPKAPGVQVIQTLRQAQIKTPIIVLTARDTIEDCVNALNQGADDYMTKPFDLNELVARIHALSRRLTGRIETIIRFNNIELNPEGRLVRVDGHDIHLPRREFVLLKKFLENPGKVLTREQLSQTLYTWNDEVDSNTLEVHIHNIRKKIISAPIRTIRGIGYILEKLKHND